MRNCGDRIGQDQREFVPAQPGHRLGHLGDRVVVVHHRTVSGPPARRQPHPGQALLGGFDQVEAALTAVAARHRQREAADLPDGLGDPVEQVRPVVDEPLRPVGAAVLLVGDEREHQIPRRHDAVAFEVPGDGDHHADHVLHVDRAAAPHVAVLDRPGERVHAPVGRFGGDDVEVAVDQQRAAVRVGAGQPGEHVAPPGCSCLDVLGGVADLAESVAHPFRAVGLALGGRRVTGIGGVESDQLADEVDDLVGGAGGRHGHSHHSYHRRGAVGCGDAPLDGLVWV